MAYFEFDATLGGTSTNIQNALLLGSVPATATLPVGVPTLITSADQARSLAGAGSALGRQCERWFQNNRSVPLYVLAAAEPTAAPLWQRAAGSVTWGGPATATGTIPLYIGGRLVRITVASGSTGAEVATAVAAAINANLTVCATAAVDGTNTDQTNISATQVGLLGGLRIDVALAGITGGEQLPAGVTATIVQMTGGAGSPDVAAMLASIGDAPYDFVLCPWNDTDDLNALRDFFNDTTGRWSWASQLYGHGYSAAQGSVTELSAIGNTRNDQHVSIFGFADSPAPADEWMAAYTGAAAGSLIVDPARPVQALPLNGIIAPPRQSRFTILERQVLYFDGISSYYCTDDGTAYIDRLLTTYRRNVWNAPDDSWLDVETMYTAAYFARYMKNRILLKFPRSKLADDGTRFGAGQAIVTPSIIRAELVAAYGELETLGLVENQDAFEDALIVERSRTDRNRVDVLLPPDFVNQLRIFAALVQPRLSLAA